MSAEVEVLRAWHHVTSSIQRVTAQSLNETATTEDPNQSFSISTEEEAVLHASLLCLSSHQMGSIVNDWCLGYLKRHFHSTIIPRFWAYFHGYREAKRRFHGSSSPLCAKTQRALLRKWAFFQFDRAIRYLHRVFNAYNRLIRVVDEGSGLSSLPRAFVADVRAYITYSQPRCFEPMAWLYFATAFDAYVRARATSGNSTVMMDTSNPSETTQEEVHPDPSDDDGDVDDDAGDFEEEEMGEPEESTTTRSAPKRSFAVPDMDMDAEGEGEGGGRRMGDEEGGEDSPGLLTQQFLKDPKKVNAASAAQGGGGESYDDEGSSPAEWVGKWQRVSLGTDECIAKFVEGCGFLHEMELFDRCAPTCLRMLYHKVSVHIKRKCDSNFDTENLLMSIIDWVFEVVDSWLQIVLSTPRIGSVLDRPLYHQWCTRIEYFVYHTYCRSRLDQLFEIVVDFPDSRPAIDDLRTCLAITAQHQSFVECAQRQIRRRLLHAGAKTVDILTFFVRLISVISLMYQHPGMIDRICTDIKAYVKHRKDAVRCIVCSLIDDESASSSDLCELLRGELRTTKEEDPMQTVYNSSDDEASPLAGDINTLAGRAQNNTNPANRFASNWVTTSRGAGRHHAATPPMGNSATAKAAAGGTTAAQKKRSVLKQLISIYCTKDVIITQYRQILANSLLHSSSFDTDRHVYTLELLKIRFGSTAQLTSCDAMIRDVSESRRINSNVATVPHDSSQLNLTHSEAFHGVSVQCLILSKHFWPNLKEATFKPHPDVTEIQEEYLKRFAVIKVSRELTWYQYLGCVTLELEFEGQSVVVNCSPLHASIILYLQEQDSWSCEDLADTLEIPAANLNRHIQFWVTRGAVRVSGSGDNIIYTFGERISSPDPSLSQQQQASSSQNPQPSSSGNGGGGGIVAEANFEGEGDEDGEDETTNQTEETDKIWRSVQQSVIRMLMHRQTCPLEGIYLYLRGMPMEPPFKRTQKDLKDFLADLVDDEILVLENGKYRLKNRQRASALMM